MTYTKDFLISAFLSRYYTIPASKFVELENLANAFWEECEKTTSSLTACKNKFRTYCSLDARALTEYRNDYC
jgi:hypothetical protein